MPETFITHRFLKLLSCCAVLLIQCSGLMASEQQVENRVSSKATYVPELPQDILRLIFSQVNPYTLAKAAQVSKRWHSIAKEDGLWKLYLLDLNFDPNLIASQIQKQETSFWGTIFLKAFKPNTGCKSFVISLISPSALVLFFLEYLEAHRLSHQSLADVPPPWNFSKNDQQLFDVFVEALDTAGFIAAQALTDAIMQKKDRPSPRKQHAQYWALRTTFQNYSEPSSRRTPRALASKDQLILQHFQSSSFQPLRYLQLFNVFLPSQLPKSDEFRP